MLLDQDKRQFSCHQIWCKGALIFTAGSGQGSISPGGFSLCRLAHFNLIALYWWPPRKPTQWRIERVFRGGRLNSPPQFLNILWKWNNLVSVRPNYSMFMGYLRNMRYNQQSYPQHIYTYELTFQKCWIRAWHPNPTTTSSWLCIMSISHGVITHMLSLKWLIRFWW